MAKQVDEYGLTTKERAFADLYRGDEELRGNAKRCYMAVHPKVKERTAEVEGAKLLRKPEIVSYIDMSVQKLSEASDATVERVLEELVRVGFSDPRKLFDEVGQIKPISEWDDALAAAVASVEFQVERHDDGSEVVTGTKKVRFWDKNSALEKLGKYLKMYTEKVEHSGSISVLSDEQVQERLAKLVEKAVE